MAMTRQHVLDLYFLDARGKLLEVAAFLDRLERATGEADFRIDAFRHAVQVLGEPGADRARRLLMVLSDPSTEPVPKAPGKSACGAPTPTPSPE